MDVPAILRLDAYYFSTNYDNVRRSLAKFLRTWFARAPELNVVTKAYAETLLNNGAYEESIFLSVVQTLEHFESIVFPKRSTYFVRHEWEAFLPDLNEYNA